VVRAGRAHTRLTVLVALGVLAVAIVAVWGTFGGNARSPQANVLSPSTVGGPATGPPAGQCGTVSFATATPIEITRGAEACQRVDASTGDVIHVHVTGNELGSDTAISFIDIAFIEPTGKVTCTNSGSETDLDCTAADTGSHTISVRATDGDRAGTLTLWVQKRQ
jgi:hypothetical protein